ncbi:papain-like cysteine protease family protein [Streptomyces sp. PA03-1a]|nr:papain-like cysteine protease family protein [Streptomyces sp. PA03-1a]
MSGEGPLSLRAKSSPYNKEMCAMSSAGGFPFIMEFQQKNHWCWAAATVSITRYYEPTTGWLQCLIADDQLQRGCCENPSACDEDWNFDKALDAVEHLKRWEAGSKPLKPDVAAEITSARPVAVGIHWAGGGDHVVVINGYTDDIIGPFPGMMLHEQWVQVQDPAYGPSFIQYDTLRTAYHGSGTWTDTYYTR